jgi:hypothetical protein
VSRPQGHCATRKLKKSTSSRIRTGDPPACSKVPLPTMLLHAPIMEKINPWKLRLWCQIPSTFMHYWRYVLIENFTSHNYNKNTNNRGYIDTLCKGNDNANVKLNVNCNRTTSHPLISLMHALKLANGLIHIPLPPMHPHFIYLYKSECIYVCIYVPA